MQKNNRQDERLGSAPLGRLIISMALPAVAAQLINVLYNIVDRIYIGHIAGCGDVALTGVGVTFPIITMISAFSAFAGMGGAPLASIELGKRNYGRAEKILGNSAAMILFFSAVLTVFFFVFRIPVLYAFGASDTTIGYADDYITIYLAGTIFVQLALGLNTFISGQGSARTAMLSVLIGAVLNITLDPVFIFLFGMGVRGAAVATVLSQAVSALWVVGFLRSEKSVVRLRLSVMQPDLQIIRYIAALGVSPFIMQSTESLVSITLNSGLQRYGGDLYVGTMAIMMSVMQFIFIPFQGVSQGIQPIISYNYGAGSRERVKGAFLRLLAINFTGMFLMAGIAVAAPRLYAGIFTTNRELIAMTVRYMSVFFFGMMFFGIQNACQSTFVALGQAKVSVFIALLRKVILLIPFAVIFPKFAGVAGIYWAEPAADLISVTATAVLFTIIGKRLLREMG